MPCSGDYMNATDVEVQHGRLLQVFEEVFNGVNITPSKWRDAGYDERIYGHPLSDSKRDNLTNQLCMALQQHGSAFLRGLTLEAQMWFRDHLTADRMRKRDEKTRNWSA